MHEADGHRTLADAARARALELPKANQDVTGRALLEVGQAALLLRAEAFDEASVLLGRVWRELPDGYRKGQVPMRIMRILNSAQPTVRERLLQAEPSLPGTQAARRAGRDGETVVTV